MYASSLLPSQLGIPRAAVRSGGRRRSLFLVRASDDDEIVPILSGRRKKEFNAKDMEKLRNPQLLGGQTIGDELAMIRERYLEAEERAAQHVEEKLSSAQWDGDQYIGGRWNTLSILYLVFMAAPALAGLFAWLSYGKLWGITPGLY